jgi:hypothetical protein
MIAEPRGKNWVCHVRLLLLSAALSVGISASLTAQEAGVPAGGTSGISLIDPADPGRCTHVNYSLQIEGTMKTPSPSGTTDWELKSSAKFDFVQRRFESDSVGPFALRAVRRFREAETTSLVGKDYRTQVVLSPQSGNIRIYGGEMQLIQFSPEVRLTRPQVELLQFPCDPLATTGLLPGRILKAESEKWNADSWVVPMLTGMDASITQSAICSLKSVTDSEAVIAFECQGTGAITGSATEIRLNGEMILNRKNSLIRQLKATLTEVRSPGTVSPGLDVTAQIQWSQELTEPAAELPDAIPDSFPAESQLRLTLVTPWRVLLSHDRDWHIFHETSELVMLRMLSNGSLVAQCNIASAPLLAAGKFTPESDYLAEVERAVAERKGRVRSSRVDPDRNGWRIHHVQATGEANKQILIWDYYLCTTRSGEQVSLVFSHAEDDEKVFSGVADRMLSSLTIRSARPKIALPR